MPEVIESVELAETARQRYLRYAMSVITSRALPDVRDGLKPVQRRILYAMLHDLRLRPEAKPVKSAKVVGQVMSNYHPHGDAAIYDAMVRMAQSFSLRYPLVDGQGNYGAITGDSAAAFRYTEARLRALGAQLLDSLDEDTVDTRPTYDERSQEPEVLPAPIPLILANGAAGIAVGMATNIPPHNLRELVRATVRLIDEPQTSIAQMMRSLKGPDFPTRGELLSTREELRKIYETGHGSVKLRGTYRVEEIQEPEKGKKKKKRKSRRAPRQCIVIDAIPYGTTTGQILAKIKERVESKKLPQVTHVSDQTNDKDGVRLVLELRADAQPAPIMAAVYKLTPLETNYAISLTCLLPAAGAVGRPNRHCDLKTLLRTWLDFRFETVTRALEYRKARLEERIHILRGLRTVLAKIDEAIRLIRGAANRAAASQALQERFAIDEAQAKAVLEIQLYRLAQLETSKIKDELAEKEKALNKILRLLKGKKPRWNLIKRELTDLAQTYGDKRRTKLVLQDDAEHEFDPTALIEREDTHVILTREGRLKRVRRLEDPARVRMREGDELLAVLQGSTLQHCAFLTNRGSCYVLSINDVPATKGFGEPIQKFFNFADGEHVVAALSLDPRVVKNPDKASLLLATELGNLVQVPLSSHLQASTRAGRKLLRLGKGDALVAGEVPHGRHVIVVTSKGNALRMPRADVPSVSGLGKGKRGIALARKERVVGATSDWTLELENTRGGHEVLDGHNLAFGELGAEGESISERFGYRRAIPKIELRDLSVGEGEGEEAE